MRNAADVTDQEKADIRGKANIAADDVRWKDMIEMHKVIVKSRTRMQEGTGRCN